MIAFTRILRLYPRPSNSWWVHSFSLSTIASSHWDQFHLLSLAAAISQNFMKSPTWSKKGFLDDLHFINQSNPLGCASGFFLPRQELCKVLGDSRRHAIALGHSQPVEGTSGSHPSSCGYPIADSRNSRMTMSLKRDLRLHKWIHVRRDGWLCG